MKKLVTLVLSVCLLSLLACHKDSSRPPTPPTDSTTTGSLKINLAVSENSELIISEPGGKILLDTIPPSNINLSISLKTNATLVDFTSITAGIGQYFITTFKAANPTTWTNTFITQYLAYPTPPPPTGNDTILYTNTPPLIPSSIQLFTSGGTNVNFAITSNYTLQATYAGQPGRYTFLCFPELGLYRLYPTKTVHDTVDCSVMDTDISGNYNTSSYFTFSDQSIYGFPESTDLTSGIQLYYNNSPNLPQFLYPPKVLQKYTALTYFNGSNNDICRSFTYGNTVPSTVTYPVPPSITSTQNNNFSLNLNTAKPTYYYTVWKSPTINWTLYSSPDSTTLNPVNLLTTQKSKLLQGTSLSSLTLTEFNYETIQGYNYLNFLNLVCNSVKPAYTEVTSAIFYDKTY